MKINVVMAGPIPPPVGGMGTVIEDISRSKLALLVNLVVVDTKKSTRQGRLLIEAVRTRLVLWHRWMVALRTGNGPVIAHIHTCSGLSYFLDCGLLLLARAKGLPVVLHIHGARFDQFIDELSSLGRRLAVWLALRATRVVVLSEEWKELLNKRLPGANFYVIPNGVPTPQDMTSEKIQDISIRLLFLGNLGERKGIWDLVEAVQRMQSPVHLYIVGGEEDKGAADHLRELISRYNLAGNITYVGPVYGVDKYRWLQGSDIFVLPSYAEGLPISLLEAMAAGLAIVTTPVGAIPTVIADGVHGVLISPGNVPELSHALDLLAQSRTLRRRLSTAAKERCIQEYGIDSVADRYMALYCDILDRLT